MSAPLGVMGGTFDPVHFGHLRLAQEAAAILGLERVRWIPAARPWHRDAPKAPAAQRLEMLRIAIGDNPLFELDDAEIREAAPGYTVDTLERLRRELGRERPIVLVLGSDAFGGLAGWHRWREVFDLAHIFVARRPGHPLAPEGMPAALAAEWRGRSAPPAALRAKPGGSIASQATTALNISASAIRAQLAAHRSPRYLLPSAALDYIEANGLYTRERTAA